MSKLIKLDSNGKVTHSYSIARTLGPRFTAFCGVFWMDSLELSLACANLPVSAHDFDFLEVLSNGSILTYTDKKYNDTG